MALKQIEKILKGKLWRFFGGIKPLDRKENTDSPIEELAIPSLITLPLERHLGDGGQILVQVGDKVKTGQALTIPGGRRNVPLHASTSGEIIGIGPQLLPHPSGYEGRCITIKPDGLDTPIEYEPLPNWQDKSPSELLERIRNYGVEGLGGAQFQTAAKISAALEDSVTSSNIFIVNGAECEPVATCDDRLMQEKAHEIAQGIEVVRHILRPKVIIVAIEDNKPKAIKAMREAIAKDVQLRVIPTIYPSGAARNLIKICTGIEIPYSEHTSECGIVVDNVETVYAIKQAVIDGIPLIKRVITVNGQTLGRTGNALVRLGTSVRFVLNAYKLNPERRQRVILGGPFMGFTLPSIDVPITKSATCVYVPSTKELAEQPEQMNCIRCGRCARVCPSRLVPYQLYALSRAGKHKQTKNCGMQDCTECGCCSYVCPSRIPLTQQFRKEIAILRIMDDQQKRNIRAQERMAARQERLAKEELARQKKREAALARAKALKEAEATLSPEEREAKRQEAVAQARARANAKRANANKLNTPNTQDNSLAENSLKLSESTSVDRANSSSLAKDTSDEAQHLKPSLKLQGAQQKAESSFVANNGVTPLNLHPISSQDPNSLMLNPRASQLNEALVEETSPKEKIPYALRKAGIIKHAPTIEMWPKVEEKPQDLSKVERPPQEGHVIHVKPIKPRSYLSSSVPDPNKIERKLPSRLRKNNEEDEAKITEIVAEKIIEEASPQTSTEVAKEKTTKVSNFQKEEQGLHTRDATDASDTSDDLNKLSTLKDIASADSVDTVTTTSTKAQATIQKESLQDVFKTTSTVIEKAEDQEVIAKNKQNLKQTELNDQSLNENDSFSLEESFFKDKPASFSSHFSSRSRLSSSFTRNKKKEKAQLKISQQELAKEKSTLTK